jgi:hypothetical protein
MWVVLFWNYYITEVIKRKLVLLGLWSHSGDNIQACTNFIQIQAPPSGNIPINLFTNAEAAFYTIESNFMSQI